eukprot:7360653-Prymnesium_polylepis.1
MDVQMPTLNGLDAAASIRAAESDGERLPIIALTGYAGVEEKERCLEHMDEYLTKPLVHDTLAWTLFKHVTRRAAEAHDSRAGSDACQAQSVMREGEAGCPGERPVVAAAQPGSFNGGKGAASAEDAITGASATVMAVDKSIFDPADILKNVGGNVAIMRQVLTLFNGETHLNAIEAALDSSDAQALQNEIHKFKGLLLYLHAHAAQVRVTEFEAAAYASIGVVAWSSTHWERLRDMAAQLRIDVARIDANRQAVLASG